MNHMREANMTPRLEREAGVDPRLLELQGIVRGLASELRNGGGNAAQGREHWDDFVSAQ